MKYISCFTCLYGMTVGDASVGIPDYLEECESYACGDAVDALFEEVFDNKKTIAIRGKVFYDNMEIEDKLPRLCGCWVEDPSISAMDAMCRKMEAADGTG